MTDCNPDDYRCPYTSFKKRCVELRATCPKWVHLLGRHPQTSAPIDQWDCADKWLPLLIVESAGEMRGTAAAIESFRNEMARGQQEFLALASRPRVQGLGHGRDDR